MQNKIFRGCILIQLFVAFACAEKKVIYPDELPNLIDVLNITNTGTRIETRFGSGNQNACFTESGIRGECVFLKDCPELLNIVRSRGIRTNEDIRFFRGRICRFLSNNINLCCVKERPTTRSSIRKQDIVSLSPAFEDCGFTTVPRITNGKEYPHGAHPWLVGIGFPLNDGTFRVLCGGTLITKRHVLTAAHCFVRRPGIRALTHVIVGEHRLSLNEEREEPIVAQIATQINPGYNSVSHINDIELLTMDRDVTFSSYIRPACLPIDFKNRRNLESENPLLTIIGWGDTFHRSDRGNDVPLQAKVSFVLKSSCRQSYISEPQVPLDQTQICTSGGTKDACQGDSGGPLLLEDFAGNSLVFVVGIVSFGVGCANPNFPGVFTYVPEFIDWIKENL